MKNPMAAQGITDCWNHIGVYGDCSCREIVVYAHCKNCPVYEETARSFLDRTLSDEYRMELKKALAWKQEAPGNLPMVVFRLGNDWFGLPAGDCAEITETRKPRTLPRRSGDVLLGLVNIRGEIHLCVSLRKLLGINAQGGDQKGSGYPRTVLVQKDQRCWAFPVDEVQSVYRVRRQDVQSIPGMEPVKGIFQMEGKTVQCLDENAFFALLDRSLDERG